MHSEALGRQGMIGKPGKVFHGHHTALLALNAPGFKLKIDPQGSAVEIPDQFPLSVIPVSPAETALGTFWSFFSRVRLSVTTTVEESSWYSWILAKALNPGKSYAWCNRVIFIRYLYKFQRTFSIRVFEGDFSVLETP